MFIELIATFAAGIGAAGATLLINHMSGGRLPKWAMPVMAGLAMIGFTVWSEMSWGARTAAALPEGVEVVETIEETIVWKPWTFLVPQATRLIAFDKVGARDNENAPGVRLVDLYLFARWQPARRVPQLLDCNEGRRADVTDAGLADPAAADWIPVGADDALIAAACPA